MSSIQQISSATMSPEKRAARIRHDRAVIFLGQLLVMVFIGAGALTSLTMLGNLRGW
ncbi:MAG TPA: hypothetical protein PK286_12200 [Devosia sp.]|nr:hypothetical protein [Devosia sp.]